MRKINKHIVHCSDSNFGDAQTIDRWHKEFGWSGIGYHFVIKPDGTIELGRALQEPGAHCRGHNHDSIGTCLIGIDEFTEEQFTKLKELHNTLTFLFGDISIHGHREFDTGKTCPNFDVQALFKGDV